MVNSACFVPGCRSGYPTERGKRKLQGMKNVSLFSVPRDPLLFQKWKMIIPRTDRQLTKECRICELHFTDDEIERYFITKLIDGTVSKIERDRPILKSGAIPTIFSNVPSDLKSKAQKKLSVVQDSSEEKSKENESKETSLTENSTPFLLKIKTENSTVKDSSAMLIDSEAHSPVIECTSTALLQAKAQNSENSSISIMKTETLRTELSPVSDSSSTTVMKTETHNSATDGSFFPLEILSVELLESEPEIFTFRKLLECVESIKKPTYWWCINVTFNFVACVKWNVDYVPEKRVIIENNLNCKIFLRNREICIPVRKKITCVEDVSYLLEKVEGYLVCAGADDRSMVDCQVLLPERSSTRGQFSIWCKECHLAKKRAQNTPSNRNIRKALTNEKLRQKLACSERKNVRLCCKVAKLRSQLEEASAYR